MIKRNFPIPFPTLFELTKVRISLAVSLTALTGFIIYSQSFIPDLIFPVAGVFLLASGASALNHIQEKNVDSRMDRTSGRPLPAGAIQSKHALIIAILFIMPGSIVLLLSSLSALILGLIALLWYNGIYTYLKRVTAFAVVPGSLIGAIPPVIGWTAAGGDLNHPFALALAFFFFIGQIPHFWLLLLKYGQEYEAAGLPSLTRILNKGQLRRLTFTWISATGVSAFIFPLFGMVSDALLTVLLISFSLILIVSFADLIMVRDRTIRTSQAFLKLNIYYLLIMVLLILDALIA